MKISVIVPVYNVEQFLPKCIDSILAQTFGDFELILVDDGTKDRGGEICDEYAERDSRIRVIHKPNGGLSDARNSGIDAAAGEYIVFIDSDDYIAPDMLELLVQTLESSGADLALCGFECVDLDGNSVDMGMKQLEAPAVWDESGFWQAYNAQYYSYCEVAWNKLYKRGLFENERFDLGKLHEDAYILHRIIEQCDKIACSEKRLYYYVQRSGSITAAKTIKNHFMSLEALLLRAERLCERKNPEFAAIALRNSIALVVKLSNARPDMTEAELKLFGDYYGRYKKLYRSLVTKNTPLKFKLAAGSCALSPALAEKLGL